MFERKLTAGWGDMDFNSHMRNTAYLDKSADVRMMYFSENGFPMAEFHRMRIGPVILRDELDYFREVGLLEEVRVTLEIAELSVDGSRFLIQNTFYREDGKLVARVRSKGGWLDLNARKLAAPPENLLQALQNSPRSEDFKEVPSILKGGRN
ncbi:MAG TPA: thioesterase family protein [Candidatus Acidoferrum sp.]|nr:thioesterase family protein [Candidatus Acidoferrum sp.]